MLINNSQKVILSLLLVIFLISKSQPKILLYNQTGFMDCSDNHTSIIIDQTINYTNESFRYVNVKGNILNNDGSIFMKVFPVYQSQSISNANVLSNLKVSYQSYQSNIYEGTVDLESLFSYKQLSQVNIQLTKQNKRLKQIKIAYNRVIKSQNNNFIPLNCLTYTIITQISVIQIQTKPICSIFGTNLTNLYLQDRCNCLQGYYNKDCSLKLKKYDKINESRIVPKSSLFFYFIPQKTNSFYRVYFYEPRLKFIFSVQPLNVYPYLSVANFYNNISNTQLFYINFNQALLITITNPTNQSLFHQFSIKQVQNPKIIYKQLIIVASTIFGILIFALVLFYCICINNCYRYSRKVANIIKFKAADVFPSISYSLYKEQIVKITESQIKTCAICLQNIDDKSNVKITYCNHTFDSKCLEQWMERQQSCPLCRQSFNDKNLQSWESKIEIFMKSKNNNKVKCKPSRRLSTELKAINITGQNQTFQELNVKNLQKGKVNLSFNQQIQQQHSNKTLPPNSQKKHIQSQIYHFYKSITLYHQNLSLNLQIQEKGQQQLQNFNEQFYTGEFNTIEFKKIIINNQPPNQQIIFNDNIQDSQFD